MLTYQTGDATRPMGPGPKVIVHVCNDAGHWGAGFVLALSCRWTAPEEAFRAWAAGAGDRAFELGQAQFVPVEPDLWVANLIGQHDVQRKTRPTDGPPVRSDAFREGLARTCAFARKHSASVHMPRIDAGLAGGDWRVIERILQDELTNQGIPVTVYDRP